MYQLVSSEAMWLVFLLFSHAETDMHFTWNLCMLFGQEERQLSIRCHSYYLLRVLFAALPKKARSLLIQGWHPLQFSWNVLCSYYENRQLARNFVESRVTL